MKTKHLRGNAQEYMNLFLVFLAILFADAGRARAGGIGWDAESQPDIYAHTLYDYQPAEVRFFKNGSKGPSLRGEKNHTQALSISAIPIRSGAWTPDPQGEAKQCPMPVFGIRSVAPGKEILLKIGVTQHVLSADLASEWIGILWNGKLLDAFHWGKDRHLAKNLTLELKVPPKWVESQNVLGLETDWGWCGLNAIVIEGGEGLKWMDRSDVAALCHNKIYASRRLPSMKAAAKDKVLLLSANARMTTTCWREYVLKPLGVQVEESTVRDCLPSSWQKHRLVILAPHSYDGLLDEDRADIAQYVEKGGRLIANLASYARLANLKDLMESEKNMLGGFPVYTRKENILFHAVTVENMSYPFMNMFSAGQVLDKQALFPHGNFLLPWEDDAAETLMGVEMNRPMAMLSFHRYGKGWAATTGFNNLPHELVHVYRKMVVFALDGEVRRP